MYNYANLNDAEFESLCRDIMSRKLGVPLRRFGPGKDGGVDLTDDVHTRNIIVQVKHYKLSTVENLVRSLKGELSKVERLKPGKYYICCSRELSVNNIDELFQHFREYMASDKHILTILEIDDFLKQPENRDIVKKHFKLWLDDSGILEELHNDQIFVDCEAFLDDAESLQKRFVKTKAFDLARKALEKNHPLCIIGDPGVGKSITSKMLVLYFASLGYRVRYTSNVSDLGALKASLRRDPEAKEVIVLDDCFGQAYFEMRASQSSELVALLKYVKNHKNKRLILNSRVTIFQEARQRQRELMRCLEDQELKVQLLDINNLSEEEKARILYNHMYFSRLPDAYFEEIRKEGRYRKIISHRNFNPRIVEFVCSPRRFQQVPSAEYFHLFLHHLDNPREIWADEYDNRLQPVDRILLQTIYSLTATTVDLELVRRCFNRRISTIPSVDKTINQFEHSLERLSGGFVRILDNKGKKELTMRNPSVNDFLDSRLISDSCERTELLCSISCVYQLRLLPESERMPYIVDLLRTGRIDQFIFLDSDSRTDIIGFTILSSGIYFVQYRQELMAYLRSIFFQHSCSYVLFKKRIDIKTRILDSEIWDAYDLPSFFIESKNLYKFLSYFSLEEGVDFICAVDHSFCGKRRIDYVLQAEEYLGEAIEDFCDVDADRYSHLLDVESAVRSTYTLYPDGAEYDDDEASEVLDQRVREEAYEDLLNILNKLPSDFASFAEDITENSISVYGSENLVQDYYTNLYDRYDRDDDDEEEDSSEETRDYSAVDAIFQR